MVLSLFQEATCSHLLFSKVLSFFEISICNCLYFQRRVNSPPVTAIHSTFFCYQGAVVATISNLLYFFWTGGVVERDIIVINYDTYLVSGMYKLKDSLVFDDIDSSHHLFYGTVIISREYLKRSVTSMALYLFRNTYCNHSFSK